MARTNPKAPRSPRRPSPLDEEVHNIEHENIEAAGHSSFGVDSGDGEWQDPTLLDAPPPRPGFAQLWVRTVIAGQPDTMNFATALRRGWKPRQADSVPDGFTAPTIKHQTYGDIIGIEGNVLMEMPTKLHERMQSHYDERTQRLVDSVNQNKFAEERPGRPIHKVRKTTVSRRPDIATQ